jgi:acyl-coenzyme A synthetase/AMP-(fatty) acid ligase
MERIDRHARLPGGGPQTFWGLVEWRAARTPEGLCLVDERGRRLSFGGYRDQVLAVAAGLHARGVGAGSVVAWQLPTVIEALVVCGALSRLGARQVPIIPIARDREVAVVLDQTAPTHLVVPASWKGRDHRAEGEAIARTRGLDLLVVDGPLPTGDPASLPPVEPSIGPDGRDLDPIRWIYFTSGTTGAPKGALHTDASLIWAAHAEVECLDLHPSDRTTIVFPVAHVGGAFFFMAGLISGHGQILISSFDETSVAVLQREGVTYAGAGLSFQRVYLEAQRRNPEVALFPAIRGFPHGGDAKRPHVHDALVREIGGVGVLSGYGMTELGMIASGTPDDPRDKLLHRIGRPCTGIEVRIVDGAGRVCPPGVEGEIRAKGPSRCRGFVDPAQEAVAFDDEGFLRTGDVGFLDDEGYLELTGRLKDIIIRKGENISAVEVEDLLHAHPHIAEVAVVGVPDEDRGECCCAVVVPANAWATFEVGAMTSFLVDAGLMVQKCPERIERRAALPRDHFGKVNKALLRAELAATAGSSAE